MRCGTSCFNRTIYWNCLRRYWPVWATLLLWWVLLLPVSILGDTSLGMLRNVGGYGGILLAAIYGVVAAMAVFSWMYNPRGAGFMASLPLRRESLFLSSWLAGYTMLAVPGILAAALGLLASVCAEAEAGSLLLVWLGQYLLMGLLFFGIASLSAQLTGTMWVLPVAYLALNLAVIVYWLLISNLLELLLWGYSQSSMPRAVVYLSPVVVLFSLEWGNVPFSDWGWLLLYAGVGLALSALGLWLFRRRRMEAATDTVAVSVLKPVFRWCAAIASALVLGEVLYVLLVSNRYRTLPMTLFLLLGGVLGWLAAEMLVRRSFRVASCLKTLPVFALLLLTFGVGMGSGGFGYTDYVPRAEQVQSLAFWYGGSTVTVTAPEELEIFRRIHSRAAGQPGTEYGVGMELTYTLHNGKLVRRYYCGVELEDGEWAALNALAQEQTLAQLQDELENGRFNSCEAVRYGTKREKFQLTQAQKQALLAAIRQDVVQGTLNLNGSWVYDRDDTAADSEEPFQITWECYGSDREYSGCFSFRVTPAAAYSYRLLLDWAREGELPT